MQSSETEDSQQQQPQQHLLLLRSKSSPPAPRPAQASKSKAPSSSVDAGVLWSLEDTIRPSGVTTNHNNDENENKNNNNKPTATSTAGQLLFGTSKNLFGSSSPASPSSGGGAGGAGGLLQFGSGNPLSTNNTNDYLKRLQQHHPRGPTLVNSPHSYRSPSNNNNPNNNIINKNHILVDQTEPLPPLRAFLANWSLANAHLFSNNSKNAAALLAGEDEKQYHDKQKSSSKTNTTFSRANIHNLCENLGIETLEQFCNVPAVKISEASSAIKKKPDDLNHTFQRQHKNNEQDEGATSTISVVPPVDPVVVFRAVSDAHRELKRVGAPIDWHRRLRPLYDVYCPAKTQQLPLLLQAYTGEEEALWRAVREKYEHEFAVAAAVLDVQAQHHLVDDENNVKNNNDSSNYVVPEQLQAKIQEQEQTITMLQQLFAQSQEDLRALANEYNEGMSKTTERAEKAEAELNKLRLVNVEQLEWIKVLEQRLAAATSNNNQRSASSASHHSTMTSPIAAKLMASSQNNYHQKTPLSSPVAATGRRSPSSASTGNNINMINSLTQHQQQQQRLRSKLTDFYHQYDPSRIPEVDAVLEQWSGKELELEKLLETPPTVMS